jgi:hypothetical protein
LHHRLGVQLIILFLDFYQNHLSTPFIFAINIKIPMRSEK